MQALEDKDFYEFCSLVYPKHREEAWHVIGAP